MKKVFLIVLICMTSVLSSTHASNMYNQGSLDKRVAMVVERQASAQRIVRIERVLDRLEVVYPRLSRGDKRLADMLKISLINHKKTLKSTSLPMTGSMAGSTTGSQQNITGSQSYTGALSTGIVDTQLSGMQHTYYQSCTGIVFVQSGSITLYDKLLTGGQFFVLSDTSDCKVVQLTIKNNASLVFDIYTNRGVRIDGMTLDIAGLSRVKGNDNNYLLATFPVGVIQRYGQSVMPIIIDTAGSVVVPPQPRSITSIRYGGGNTISATTRDGKQAEYVVK